MKQAQPTPAPTHAMAGFALASLAPAALLALGAAWGLPWLLAALAYLTVFAALVDRFAPPATAPAGAEFPAGTPLLVALALAHLALLPLGVWMVSGDSGLTAAGRAAAFMAFGLYLGQVSNPAAHELIHRGDRRLRALGALIFVTLLFGHHVSAHRLVHHRHVASAADPNTARRGESFYAYAPRAWAGSFRSGLAAENLRPRRALHPYAAYLAGAAICLGVAAGPGGAAGLVAYVGLALYATAQLLLSDYVQHYGLERARLPDGRLEPVGPAHSWNAAPPFSGAMMLNAPRHSDHHAHPARPFAALRLPPGAPLLPRSVPVMAALALAPPLWRRVMDPRLPPGSRESDRRGAGAALADLAG